MPVTMVGRMKLDTNERALSPSALIGCEVVAVLGGGWVRAEAPETDVGVRGGVCRCDIEVLCTCWARVVVWGRFLLCTLYIRGISLISAFLSAFCRSGRCVMQGAFSALHFSSK